MTGATGISFDDEVVTPRLDRLDCKPDPLQCVNVDCQGESGDASCQQGYSVTDLRQETAGWYFSCRPDDCVEFTSFNEGRLESQPFTEQVLISQQHYADSGAVVHNFFYEIAYRHFNSVSTLKHEVQFVFQTCSEDASFTPMFL